MRQHCGSFVGAIRRFGREQTAAPIVEFALIFPLLMVIVMGMVDLGRAYFVRNALVSAVRQGARFASVQTQPCSNAGQGLIKDQVVRAFAPVGGAAIRLDQITIPTCSATTIQDIRIEVNGYQFRPITPLPGLGSSISLSAAATFRWELSS
jgi:Flp pilus assembly protein TadG